MALRKEDIKRIAALLHLKEADIEAAIAAEGETALSIDETLTAFTEAELNTLKGNEYKSGKEKGVEMAVKEVKEKQGLDFQGKTIDGLLTAYQKKVLEDAKIEPAEKVKELEGKLSTLQNTVKEYEGKIAEKDKEVSTTKVRTELYKHIPVFGEDGPALEQDDVINMMGAKGYEFKLENGKTVAYKDGQKVTDKLSNDLPVKDVVESFLKEKKLIADPVQHGGRGDGDKKPVSQPMKLSELKKQFQDQGKSLLGQEFTQAVQKAVAENKEFNLNE